jgi:hypothetical protein
MRRHASPAGTALALWAANENNCPFATNPKGALTMSKPIEKTPTKPLIHRPWDVLDAFGFYDDDNLHWVEFDASVSQQLRDLEDKNRRFIRPLTASSRQSSR